MFLLTLTILYLEKIKGCLSSYVFLIETCPRYGTLSYFKMKICAETCYIQRLILVFVLPPFLFSLLGFQSVYLLPPFLFILCSLLLYCSVFSSLSPPSLLPSLTYLLRFPLHVCVYIALLFQCFFLGYCLFLVIAGFFEYRCSVMFYIFFIFLAQPCLYVISQVFYFPIGILFTMFQGYCCILRSLLHIACWLPGWLALLMLTHFFDQNITMKHKCCHNTQLKFKHDSNG